ncbi:MAG: Nif3-like dinuclear metal center hexameric protein [Acidobacteriota bacterium]
MTSGPPFDHPTTPESRTPPPDRSRREFVLAGAAVLLAGVSGRAQRPAVTAQQVVDRIRSSVGVPWRDTTVDTFKAGDPNVVVTGIATTVMATMPVLRQAAAAGRNLIITYEPVFYAGNDAPGPRATDPVYLAKQAFIDEHHLVVWRFSDHWQARKPNELTSALAETLGWSAGRTAGNDSLFAVPPTTLGAVANHVRTRLGIRGGMRTVGQAGYRITRIALSPGTSDLLSSVQMLQQADLIVSGEPREWEAVEYVFDTASAGQPKSMIAVGRLVSEEPGMRACAAWLGKLVPEVPVENIAIGDPYWRPSL